jgi:hypothetical protein
MALLCTGYALQLLSGPVFAGVVRSLLLAEVGFRCPGGSTVLQLLGAASLSVDQLCRLLRLAIDKGARSITQGLAQ